MTRLAAALLAGAAAAAAAAAGAAPLTGSLVGLYLLSGDAFTNLTMIAIDPATGANRTVANGLSLGDGLSQIYPAVSALLPTGELAVAAATADAIYSFDVTTGARRTLAPLPPWGDGSDPYLALEFVAGELYFLTQSGLSTVSGGRLTQVAAYTTLPDEAVWALVPSGGTGGKGALVVGNASMADGQHVQPTVFSIDFGAGYAVSAARSINMTSKDGQFMDMWDLAWSPFLGKLWAFGGWYQSWLLSYPGWALEYVQPVIDGPGYPSVSAISADGRAFAFLDFDSFHVIDLTASPPAYVVRAEFYAAPRRVGFMRWVGSSHAAAGVGAGVGAAAARV